MQCTLKIAPDTSIDTAEVQLSDCTVQTEAGLCGAVWSFGAVALKWCVSADKLTGSGDSAPWREAAVTGPFCFNKRKILIFLFLCKAVPDTFIKINFIYSVFFYRLFAAHAIILNAYFFSCAQRPHMSMEVLCLLLEPCRVSKRYWFSPIHMLFVFRSVLEEDHCRWTMENLL